MNQEINTNKIKENVNLEYLLQKYFGLKRNLFLANPKIIEYCDDMPIYDNMSVAGHKSYKKMIDFIYDLSKLGVNGLDENSLVDCLDSITNEL